MIHATDPAALALVAAWQTEAEGGNEAADLYLRMARGVDGDASEFILSLAANLPRIMAQTGRLISAGTEALEALAPEASPRAQDDGPGLDLLLGEYPDLAPLDRPDPGDTITGRLRELGYLDGEEVDDEA